MADYDTLGSLTCSDGQIIVWRTATSSWTCTNISDAIGATVGDIVTENISNYITEAITEGDEITSTTTEMHSHDGDTNTTTTINTRFEQGRIAVTAGEVSTCQSRNIGGYADLSGEVSFETPYASTTNLVITATYETSTDPTGIMDTSINILPIEIRKITSGATITGFRAYGCPPTAGHIAWRAAGN